MEICELLSKGLSPENYESLRKKIGKIRERINYKIKKKKIQSRKKHHLIYDNFWQFIEIFLGDTPMKQDSLRNNCRNSFKNIIQNKNFVISHDFKEEIGKNTMIFV